MKSVPHFCSALLTLGGRRSKYIYIVLTTACLYLLIFSAVVQAFPELSHLMNCKTFSTILSPLIITCKAARKDVALRL
jgi:hypothetical protein